MATVATITNFGLQTGTDRTIYAAWSWTNSNTDKYQAKWWYDTGNGVWFVGSDSEVTERHSTYSAPANAKRVCFQVKPISKTYKSNDKDVYYWTASWSTSKYYDFVAVPATPSQPNVTLNGYNLTARVDNYTDGTEIQFQIIQNDSNVYKTGTASVITNSASYSCKINIGSEYKVRCRSKKNGVYSEWSAYSSNIATIPDAPSSITSCVAVSETSVRLTWDASKGAKTYTIQYAIDKSYFEGSNALQEQTGITGTTYTLTGLESGKTFFFRLKAVNNQGESGWTGVKSVVIGTKPNPPTTWSSTTIGVIGESIKLYWIHNSEDGSKESSAKIEISVTGETKIFEISNKEDTDENRFYTLDTTQFKDGTEVKWRVCTKGAVAEYGDWSIKRTITVYTPPVLSINVMDSKQNSVDTITSFPLFIGCQYSPNTQTPIGYHLSIVSNESYECWDEVGNRKMVSEGDEVYSRFYDTNQNQLFEIQPTDLDLENNISYTVKGVVSMNTGLTAEDTAEFVVSWSDTIYSPNAEITYDPETLCTHIRPYCDMYPMIFYEVVYEPSTGYFYRTNSTLEDMSGVLVKDCYTDEYNDVVYSGTTGAGEQVYFCIVQSDTPTLLDNVTLSVYRREYDGRFVEIGAGINNEDATFITDPHPALDYARYRIVAISNKTGAISFNDISGFPIGEKSVIIQWDEVWSSFEANEEEVQMQKPVWSGSMLKLPFNIDISDNNSVDVNMVEYIGRSHPVSYYGTQIGATATWNVEIPKYDKNTLYALRRLAIYMGDVYVREPSGSGYWASISVSFDQKHCQQTIPVSLNIKRVEGGI